MMGTIANLISEQLQTNATNKLVVYAGQYGIFDKAQSPELTILAQGEKFSTILIIESACGFGIAHIDTPTHASAITLEVVNHLRKLEAKRESNNAINQMSAILIGGAKSDFIFKGFPFNRTNSAICNSIYQVLSKERIAFTHKNYQCDISPLFLPSVYLVFYLLGLIDSEASYLKITLGILVCFMLQLGINQMQLQPQDKYYVKAKLATYEVKIISGTPSTSKFLSRPLDEMLTIAGLTGTTAFSRNLLTFFATNNEDKREASKLVDVSIRPSV